MGLLPNKCLECGHLTQNKSKICDFCKVTDE